MPLFFISGDERYTDYNILSKIFVEYPFGVNADAMWFLMALFIIYIVAYVGREIFRYRRRTATPMLCGQIFFFLVCVHFASPFFPTQFHLDRVALYAVHFFSGYVINIYKTNIKKEFSLSLVILCACASVAIIYAIDYHYSFLAGDITPNYSPIGVFFLKLLELVKQFVIVGIFVLLTRQLVRSRPKVMTYPLIQYLNRRSFDIYLYHWPVLLILLDCLAIQSPLQKAMVSAMGSLFVSLVVGEVVARVRKRTVGHFDNMSLHGK